TTYYTRGVVDMQEIPVNISLGLTMGTIAGTLFLIANLYVFFHLINQLVAPKKQWKWLDKMRNRWHYVHYLGNAAAFIAALVHGVLMLQYASVFHGVLIAVMAWMVFAGFTMRFTKASLKFKKTLRIFHAKWYMFVIVLVLLIIAHIASLGSFPYPLG
ncbi:hypothetical protein, partial [Petrotoga halophila]|uniref:hypothetical protein n=1 Tax=Petrotoga halophila TaxID=301141 RepID=UPI00318357D6